MEENSMKKTVKAKSQNPTAEALIKQFDRLPRNNPDITIKGKNVILRGKTLAIVEASSRILNVKPAAFVQLALMHGVREEAKQTIAKMDSLIKQVAGRA
jgi:hypothetical protein